MDWSNEQYVRLYTRDTPNWIKLRWEAQCLFVLLLRKVDRSGVIDGIDEPVDDISLLTGLPVEHVESGLRRLIKTETVVLSNGSLCIPNFIEANESRKSDRLRAKEYRQRRRDLKIVTMRDADVTSCDPNVTENHTASHGVTQRHTASLYPNPNPNLTLPKPDPNPSKKKRAHARVEYTKDFLAFWAVYPRKDKKKDAMKAWKKAEDRPDIDSLLAIVEEQKASGCLRDPQYCPLPTSWLNGGRWEDENDKRIVEVPRNETAIEGAHRRNKEALERIRKNIEDRGV
jgi:hypothetical protein